MSTFNDIRARFSAAMINEGKKGASFSLNLPFIKFLEINPDAQQFINDLPAGLPRTAFVEKIDKMNPKQTEDLIKIFKSKSGSNLESELNKINHTDKSSVPGILFDTQNTGIGKGELLIAWIFKGATINGGSQSYDVSLDGKKYEVKDLGGAKFIKVGTQGMASKFDFGAEFVDTIRRMHKLTRDGKINIETQLTDEERKVWKKLSQDKEIDKIMSGEISSSRINLFKNFYNVFNKSEINDISGFNNVILRGPFSKPVELSIEPTELKDIKPGDKIAMTVSKSELDRSYLMTELRRLKYVRNPELVDSDIQDAVDSLVIDKSFIFFSDKNGVIVTNKIKSYSITQGRLVVGPA